MKKIFLIMLLFVSLISCKEKQSIMKALELSEVSNIIKTEERVRIELLFSDTTHYRGAVIVYNKGKGMFISLIKEGKWTTIQRNQLDKESKKMLDSLFLFTKNKKVSIWFHMDFFLFEKFMVSNYNNTKVFSLP